MLMAFSGQKIYIQEQGTSRIGALMSSILSNHALNQIIKMDGDRSLPNFK